MIEQVLQEIGLTKNEIKVYKALLELGECKTGDILTKSGLNSGRIYEILNSLQNKGLVSSITKSGVKYFSPADPRRVLDYLDEKNKEIEQQKKDYNEILPNLLNKISSIKPEAKIEVLVGLNGMKTAWQKEFNFPKSETLYLMSIAASAKYPKAVWNYFTNIHRPRRDRAGFKILKILDKEAKTERKFHEKRAQIRYLPIGSMVSIGIIGNLTTIGIFTETLVSLSIESEEIANYFKEQFEHAWKQAKP